MTPYHPATRLNKNQEGRRKLCLYRKKQTAFPTRNRCQPHLGKVAPNLSKSTSRFKNDLVHRKTTLDDGAKGKVLLPERGNRHNKAWQEP